MCERVRCKQCDKVREVPEEVFMCSTSGCDKLDCCHRLNMVVRRATKEECMFVNKPSVMIMKTLCDICLEELRKTATVNDVDGIQDIPKQKQ